MSFIFTFVTKRDKHINKQNPNKGLCSAEMFFLEQAMTAIAKKMQCNATNIFYYS